MHCNRGSHSLEMNLVTVYDINNKFIAYTAPYPEVIDIMCEAGAIYILSGDRKVGFFWQFRAAGSFDGVEVWLCLGFCCRCFFGSCKKPVYLFCEVVQNMDSGSDCGLLLKH